MNNENTEFNFSGKCKTILENNGYNVKIVKGENVTIKMMMETNWEKDLIIFRMHSGVFENDIWFFTGEKYGNSKYVLEQLSGLVNIGKCPSYNYTVNTFSSKFIENYMDFKEDSTMILMGCNSLEELRFADAFHNKKCNVIIGWSGSISINETDTAILELITRWTDGDSMKSIVDEINTSEINSEKEVLEISIR